MDIDSHSDFYTDSDSDSDNNFDKYSIKINKIIYNKDDNLLKYINRFKGEYLFYRFAIDISNGNHIFSTSAYKNLKLICPECNGNVIYCIRVKHKDETQDPTPYFRHNLDEELEEKCKKCKNYNKNEKIKKLKEKNIDEINLSLTDIHNIAIKTVKNHLLAKNILTINKICDFSYKSTSCNSNKSTTIILLDGYTIKEEYTFNFDNHNYRADLAILDKDNNLKYIIEICHTHQTDESKRPNNIFWCDISASDILYKRNYNHTFTFNCLRRHFCNDCKIKITELQEKHNQEKEKIRLAREEKERLKKAEEEKIFIKKIYSKVMNELIKVIKEKVKIANQLIEEEKAKIAKQYLEKKLMIRVKKIKNNNLICTSCKYIITNTDYKYLYMRVDNLKEKIKSNIIICDNCYYNTFCTTSFKKKHPEIYLNEYNRIKKIEFI